MEKKIRILYAIQQGEGCSQRKLAVRTGISVGLVNRLLRQLQQEGLVEERERGYGVTEAGIRILEESWQEQQEKKLSVEAGGTVTEAIILAAGANENFDCPVCLLPVDGLPLIEHLIRDLQDLGIHRICVVGGFQIEQLREHFAGRDIQLVENPRYLWTGTMASLACGQEFLTGDFLIVESNQILERAALERVLYKEGANACLMVNPSGSSDEAYVELDEDGSIFRISKDIRQMNRIDGELVGVCKISHKLYERMLKYYERNENPLLNYEYVLESIGRLFWIPAVREDDLQWTVIENALLYERARNQVYPRIRKKNAIRLENRAREVFASCLPAETVEEFRVCGGMTNTNFYVKTEKGAYVLRVPGAGTDKMINRGQEGHNARLGEQLGINVPTLYFNAQTGVKITAYLQEAETLNGKTAQWENNIKKSTALLRKLHTSDVQMENTFSVKAEYERYKAQIEETGSSQYAGFWEMDAWFYHLQERLAVIGTESRPCHNDLVPENFIKDQTGRMYLIDWEYAGKNDPMWDLAAHLLECDFSQKTGRLFLEYYFQGEVPARALEKILIFQTCQDILWSAWTRLKEIKGENFGTYGVDRLARAQRLKEAYRRAYEKEENKEQ